MEKNQYHLFEGAIVQLNPETTKNRMLAGCFMVITELKPFGVQGYIQCPGSAGEPGGQAYYRASFEEFEPVIAENAIATAEWWIP